MAGMGFVFAPVAFILGAVDEQVAVQLFDMVFCEERIR
jgi:hypothetical protein